MYLVNKYSKWYYQIINAAQQRKLFKEEYKERHHIIPKSLGGSNSKENLIDLTAREHFVCHLLLTRMLTGKEKAKMIHAVNQLMSQKNQHQFDRYVPNSRIYEMIKTKLQEIKSISMKLDNPMSNPQVKDKHQLAMNKRGKSSGMSGKTHSEETKAKMKIKRAEQVITDAAKEKISKTIKELINGSEYVNPMDRPGVKEKHLERCLQRSGIKLECPHCKQLFSKNTLARWHGDNCKQK